jgi:hypothetical protein
MGSKSLYFKPLDGGERLIESRRLRRASWALWLALLALAFEALVPIHLALDLDEALSIAHRAAPAAARHGFEWRLLALAAGHDIGDGEPDGDHRHPICPAYAALGALGGFAAVAASILSAPAHVAMLPPFARLFGEPDRPAVAGYRSRAPPPV